MNKNESLLDQTYPDAATAESPTILFNTIKITNLIMKLTQQQQEIEESLKQIDVIFVTIRDYLNQELMQSSHSKNKYDKWRSLSFYSARFQIAAFQSLWFSLVFALFEVWVYLLTGCIFARRVSRFSSLFRSLVVCCICFFAGDCFWCFSFYFCLRVLRC